MPTKEVIEAQRPTKEIIVKTKSKPRASETGQSYKWWLAQSDSDLIDQLLQTTDYLTKIHQVRIRQASIFTRLLSGKPLYNYLANVGTLDNSQQLPIGRPTANVCYSCTDTLVSRLTQNRPKPTFLTNGAHYKQRRLAEEYNDFTYGEFFRLKAWANTALALRDSCAIGDGFLKVYPLDNKVAMDRVLSTELLTDYNDSYYGKPRMLIHKKMVDRNVAMGMFQKSEAALLKAQPGKIDNTPLSTDTASDQIILAEGWRLPSFEGAKDGRHVIVCSAGVLLDESWERDHFPFARVGYNPNIVGYFSQSLCEILMPTQMEIYKLLIVASQAIELMGVPRIYIDELSAITETAFNNNIGTIIKGRGQAPQFLNATSNAPEIYEWIKWLIENAYQMSGVSAMSAAAQIPAGLKSGEAQRVFLSTQDARFNALERRFYEMHDELAYLIMETAAEIAEETGKYSTVYPGQDGIKKVDLPKAKLLKNTYVIQSYQESALVKDPAGRQAQLSEMLAAGEITLREFRRQSNYPDLDQDNQLANAQEERILHDLDAIIDDGEFNRPDPFVLSPDDLATTLTVQYINKYAVTDLEEEKMQMLRDYFTEIQNLKGQAAPPPPAQAPAQSNVPVQPPAPSISPTSNVQV
jgi:hypothetical protein